jgi:small subunit ribosomal protein S5
MFEKRQRKNDRSVRADKPSEEEFEQQIIDLARVTRVMAGGKRMRFRACVAIGDRKHRVGFGVAKGADVTVAVNKAATKAKKNLLTLEFVNDTIRHRVEAKYKAAYVLMRPAQSGKGIVAGGSMRQILQLCGVKNVVGKMLGSKNKINNVRATLKALMELKTSKDIERQLPMGTDVTSEETAKTVNAPESLEE